MRSHPVWVDAGEVLADIDEFLVALRVQIQARRARHVRPLRFELALRAEYLDAMVFAVGDIDPAVLVHADIVHDVELTWVVARFAPREQVLAVRRILVHRRVGVAVAHIEIAVARVECDMRRRVERLAAHRRRRLPRRADGHQHFAVRRHLANGVVAIVHAPQIAVRTYGDTVRVGENAVSPSPLHIAFRVEHNHRMRAAIEHIHIVVGVHIDGGRFLVSRAFRQIAPVIARHFIDPFARTKQYHSSILHRLNIVALPSAPKRTRLN